MHRLPFCFLLVLSLFGLYNETLAQDIITNQTQYIFQSANESQSRNLSVQLTNNSTKTAHIVGYSSISPFGKRAFRLNDSIFSIPAGGSYSLTVYFQPLHNILYQSDLVLHTDSAFGSIPISLQGQGTFSNTYYASTQNQSGSLLKSTLHNIISSGYNQLSYNTARDEMYSYVDNIGGQVSCVYTGRSATFNTRAGANANNINAEHTMPQSTFGSASPMQSDIHHLFPCDASANSVRNNHPFGYVPSPTWSVGGSKYGSSVFEPRDFHKGSAARALLYFLLRYQDYGGFIAAMESNLISWHNQFPPTSDNKSRNDRVYVVQNNRNPLVDYPQFSQRLGSFSGSGALPTLNTWRAFTDTLWVESGIEACLSIQNTGNTTAQISGTNSSAPISLNVSNNTIGSGRTTCIRIQATTNSSFSPTLVTIQSSSHSNLNVYVASRGSSSGPPVGSIPSPSQLSALSSGTQQLSIQIDAPTSGYGTLWNGMLVFASTHPFVDFNLNNPLEAATYTPSSQFGSGSSVVSDLGQTGYCVAKNAAAGNVSITINGLTPNTNYYIYALCYKLVSGNDDFSTGIQSGFSTDPIIVVPPAPSTCEGGIFFSEYIEGSSNNKCLELFNASDSTINLSELTIYTLFNAGPTTSNYTLSGNLAAGSTYVICNSSATSDFTQKANINLSQSIVNFNGNDLVSLVKISTGDTLDRIGDPNQINTIWSIPSGSGNTQNYTLVRADSVRYGGKTWAKSRLQWYALPSNTSDSLGSHSIKPCASSSLPSLPYAYSPSGDQFGKSVSLGSEYAFIGSPTYAGYLPESADGDEGGLQTRMGAVFIYRKVDGQWIEWQRIQPITASEGSRFGESVSGNDSFFIAGAPGEGVDSTGFVYIYEKNAFDHWNLVLRTHLGGSSNPSAQLGSRVALADTLAAASTAYGKGKVQLFRRKANGQWYPAGLLEAADGFIGDGFGSALSFSNDSLLIGAEGNRAAYLFVNQNGNWNFQNKFTPSVVSASSSFGHAVLLGDGRCFIGDPDVERVYSYSFGGGQWTEASLEAMDQNLGNYFGSSLHYNANGKLFIGSEGDGGGSVYSFTFLSGNWSQTQKIVGNGLSNADRFGFSIHSNGTEILIGAPLNQSSLSKSAKSTLRGGVFFFTLTP
jgi:endonuclease I